MMTQLIKRSDTESISIRNKTISLIEEINSKFLERDEVIRLILLSIFSKKHIFLIGLPGTAKTDLARLMKYVIEDSIFWGLLFDTKTKKNQVFGKTLYDEDGNAIYSKNHTVLGAHILFFDEMFKAKNELLNSFLEILAERAYSQKGEQIPVPLISAIGSSNELPEGKVIAPFVDRFLFFYDVQRIQSVDNFKKLLKGEFDKSKLINNKIYLWELDEIEKKTKDVIVSDEFIDKFIGIREKISKINSMLDGVSLAEVSDRKYIFIMATFKSAAVVNEHKELDFSYLLLLAHMLWRNYDEKKKVKKVIYDELFSSENFVKKIFVEESRKIGSINSLFAKYREYIDNRLKIPSGNNNAEKIFLSLFHQIQAINEDINTSLDKINDVFIWNSNNNEMIKKIKENIFVSNDIGDIRFSEDLMGDIIVLKQKYETMSVTLKNWMLKNNSLSKYNYNCLNH